MRSRALPLLAVVAVLATGCGADDEASAPPVKRQEETVDKLPDLPSGYEEFVNRDGGVAFGRPPGWSANAKGATTTLTAPDGLVSATITIDRTDDALEVGPMAFAAETASLLPGFEQPLKPKKPRVYELKHEYESAIVEADGVRKKDGLRQVVRVVVLERKGVAVVTAVIAENAEENAGLEFAQALVALQTLRTRPPG